jgi:hypothetical protein
MRLLPFFLALLAACAMAGAVAEFQQALTFWHIGSSIASAAIAVTLVVATIRTTHYARSRSLTPPVTARSAVKAFFIFAASLIGIWAGCGTLFETLELCNQEYLHWFPQNQPKMFPVSTGLAIGAFTIIGTFFLAIGLFLFWFLFFRRSKTASESIQLKDFSVGAKPDVGLDPNPYAAPHQSS